MKDLIIIGMGPAGVSAAIYAKRSNLDVLCFEGGAFGGTLNNINEVDNYPGLDRISGPDFAFKLLEQVNNLDLILKKEKVIDVVKVEDGFKVTTKKDNYFAKKVIVAVGRNPRKLGLAKEEDFLGRGISYCAICDGPFYKDREVCVVGGGEAALQETLYLARIVKKVYLVHRRDSFSASAILQNQIKKQENVEIIYNDEIKELGGEQVLEYLTLKSGRKIKVSGLFIYIGYVPNNDFLKNLDVLDEDGYIIVNNNYQTKIEGLYAIGDTIKKEYYQIAIATNEGVIAALNVAKELNKN